MVCGGCGATISDKAIVCYRCGQATTIPAAPPRSGGVKPRPSLVLPLVLLLVALALGWFGFFGTHELVPHLIAVTLAIVAAITGVVLIVRRRR